MSATAGFPSALFLIILGLSTAQGGNPSAQPGGGAPSAGEGQPAPEMLPPPGQAGAMVPPSPAMQGILPPTPPQEAPPGPIPLQSSWLRYTRPDCCCPVGGNGPIQTELFIRTGPSLVIGGGILNQALETGWEVEGGGRSLFFNPDMSAAWTLEANLVYFYNQANAGNRIPIVQTTPAPAPPGNPPTPVTPDQLHLREFHRTNVNVNVGREWFYTYRTQDWNIGWRYGIDGGGSLGTVRADFQMLTTRPHRTGILYGETVALHTDIEIPRGCCTMVSGFRLEYEHDSMPRVVQRQNNGNLSSLNFLWNLGVRF